MDAKEFFGPTTAIGAIKVAGGFVLFVVAQLFQMLTYNMMDYLASGFPFTYYESWGPCIQAGECSRSTPLGLAADLAIFYILSCLIGSVLKTRMKK